MSGVVVGARVQVAEQLSVYQQNLKEKSRHMKAMASELNMYQAQVNEYKFEIERLSREVCVCDCLLALT